jgi:translocation protein SEC63
MHVASQIPHLRIAKAFFKVMGERVVTPSSLVQLVVKARFIPPGSTNIPEVNELDLEDVDPDEDDLEGLTGRKPPKNRRQKTVDGQIIEADSKLVQPPLAFSPYYPRDHSPRWHIFLADCRAGRVAVPPFTFSSFDKPIVDSDGRPTYDIQTLKCQFQAPPMAGQYAFAMHLICDSYIGFDTKMDVVLDVKPVSEAVQEEIEDEISEPDEGTRSRPAYPLPGNWLTVPDTLAGQMQALKTGASPKKKVNRPARKEESSDDESDTEGSAGEETSETDTETDTDGE